MRRTQVPGRMPTTSGPGATGSALTLKYADDLSACKQPCPNRTRFQPRTGRGARWVHNPIRPDDFLPIEILKRNRRAATAPKDSIVDETQPRQGPQGGQVRGGCSCESLALSFFDTEERAIDRHLADVKKFGREVVSSRHGDHVTMVPLGPHDGIACAPNPDGGHFDLHEAAGVTPTLAARCGPVRRME